ncbi:MAG: DUF2279 domain-containing protein, partial [Bacteroidales bacterium]
FVFILSVFKGIAQNTNNYPYNTKRLTLVISSEVIAYGVSIFLLNNLWYKHYPRSAFHFFNDNNEWLQMDKCGHATTSYTLGSFGYSALRWCGVDKTKAIWYGGSLGAFFLLTIEVLDGFSSEWGFSPGDFTANTLGAALFIGQQSAWNEQRFNLKWSYHTTIFPSYRPDELGNGITQTWLKDYNGQTYWLSGNISSFLKSDSRFPKWLNLAFGYGAEGMIGGMQNPTVVNGVEKPHFERYRKFFLSPDVDLTRINTNSDFCKAGLGALNFLKFPAPALKFSKDSADNSIKKHLSLSPVYF